MTTGPTDARPLQVRVADDLRARIESQEYPPGKKLPTLDDLAEQFDCSLAVVRKALDMLRQQGLVITRQGTGSFVREQPQARRHGIERYSRSRWSGEHGKALLIAESEIQGQKAFQVLRYIGETPASAAVAERLGIAAGELVHARRRTTFIGDRPNQLADSFYDLSVLARAPQLGEHETGPGGGFARLEDAGYRLETIREEFFARMPTGPESVDLKLPEGTPVVELIRTAVDDNGKPVEVMVSVIAGDMIRFAYEFPIPD